jgi:hypothetical protein
MIGHGFDPGGNFFFLPLLCNIQQEKKNMRLAINLMAAVTVPLPAINVAGGGKV